MTTVWLLLLQLMIVETTQATKVGIVMRVLSVTPTWKPTVLVSRFECAHSQYLFISKVAPTSPGYNFERETIYALLFAVLT